MYLKNPSVNALSSVDATYMVIPDTINNKNAPPYFIAHDINCAVFSGVSVSFGFNPARYFNNHSVPLEGDGVVADADAILYTLLPYNNLRWFAIFSQKRR
jgi:hypothetical protein